MTYTQKEKVEKDDVSKIDINLHFHYVILTQYKQHTAADTHFTTVHSLIVAKLLEL